MTQKYDINCPKCGGTGFTMRDMGFFQQVLPCHCNKELGGSSYDPPPVITEGKIDPEGDLFKMVFGGTGKKQKDDKLDSMKFELSNIDKLLSSLGVDEPFVDTNQPDIGKEGEPLTDEDFESEIPWREFDTLMGVDPHCIGSDFDKCPVKDLEPERVHRQRVAKERCRELLKAFEAIVEDPNLTTDEHTFELISDFSGFMGDLYSGNYT